MSIKKTSVKAIDFFFIDHSLNNIPNYIMQVRIVMQVRVVLLLQNAHGAREWLLNEQLHCKKKKIAPRRKNRPCHNSLNKGLLHQP